MRPATQPRALETRDRILGEAGYLFALKGFHDTKLEEVQKAAKVTTGAFFHHFGGKEDLGFAVIDRHMENRRKLLAEIEAQQQPVSGDEPLQRVFHRLDAIQEMVRSRDRGKGGCVIGNLSTALSDCHDGFRTRLAECFEEMAQEFVPHLEAAAQRLPEPRRPEPRELAPYIVTVIEGAIMQARTFGDASLLARQFTCLKAHLDQQFRG